MDYQIPKKGFNRYCSGACTRVGACICEEHKVEILKGHVSIDHVTLVCFGSAPFGHK